MHTFSQWVHQHNFLLLSATVVVGNGILLAFRWRSLRLWLAWLSLAGLSLTILLALRTPAASLSEHRETTNGAPLTSVTTAPRSNVSFWTTEFAEPDLGSVEAIEKMIATGGKPTLVEVYADHGLS